MFKPGIGIGAVCLLALAAIATAAVPAEAASQRPKPLVKMLAPHEDGIVQGRTVTVRVRLAPRAKLRSAKLNGAGVKRLLHRRGSRLLVARMTKRRVRALRRGRNFLHLVVRRGKRHALRTIGFTLVRPLRQLVRRFNADYSRNNGLRIAMKLSRLHAKVRVTLNGRDLSGQFANELSARRKARLGADEGLRHGRNVLRVRVTHHSGLIRRFRRDFLVPRATTIAGAERDRSVPAGSGVTLNGGASRVALRADGSRKKGGLSFSWRVLRSPRGSHPKLTARHSKQPRLRTDRPGRYLVRLTTTTRSEPSGGHVSTSVDEVEVVGEPQPLVPVDTGATAGEARGFAVGVTRQCEGAAAAAQPCFYPTPGAGEDLQVLVLDRTTLEPISNKSYSSSELGTFATAMEELNENDGLPNTAPKWETGKLVMVALREGSLGESEALADGLGSFNVSSESGEAQPLEGLGEAPFSLIAVPGTLEGKAAVNYGGVQIEAPDGTKGAAGAISGFLKVVSDTPGEEEGEGGAGEFTRAFTWPDSIPYDTRYQPPESSGEPESLRIGETIVPVLPSGEPADRDGIAVFIFNPIDPEGSLERNAFVTNANGAGTDSGLDWSTLSSKLKYAIEERLGVALVSNGDIGGFATEPDASSFAAVERQLEVLGANPDIFGRAVRRNGTYSMLSAGERPGAPNIPGQVRAAYSASSVMAEGIKEGSKLTVGPGRLTGLLQRASYGAVFPSSGDPGGSEPEPELLQTIYLKQSPWLLTPAPEAAAASCQQLAFAYLTQAIGISSAAELPLWSGADASACQGIDHTGESGTRSADSLAGDSCATTEAAATGANPANVRTASLRMRSRYTDLAQVFGEGQILGVAYPAAGAPFTEADLVCAKNQMIDEVEARSQTIAFVEQLGKVQYESEGRVVTELQVIAAEVEALMLSKLKKEIENSGRATAAFWAGFALQTLSSTAKLAAAVSGSGTTTAAALRIVGQTASLGEGATSIVQAKEGNPVTLTDAYLLLASQLHQEAVKIEAQIEEVLAAQQQGALLSEAALLSDPGRLAAVDAKASGAWEVTPEGQLKAQNIYLYRVRQLAYQDFWPQAYSGARLKYSGLCARGYSACWQDGEWEEPEGGKPVAGTSLVRAGQGRCLSNNYFEGAASGSPGGIGAGNEYQPAATPSPMGQAPPSYLDYLMASTSELKNGKVSLADLDTVQLFFEQPSDSAEQPSGSAPPGFYAPEFWWQNFDMKTQVHCNGESGKLAVEKISGAYAELEGNVVWPTPPLPFCVEGTVSGHKRATCTYDQGYFNESTLNLGSLVLALGGDPATSGIWIYALGGPGAHGSNHGGSGGSGGIARTYRDNVRSFEAVFGTTAIRYYLGTGGAGGDGAGGASTLVGIGNLSSSAESPCIVADSEGIEPGGEKVSIQGLHSGSSEACTQNVVLLAGGGGGGGRGSNGGEAGKAGSRGGEALATTQSMVAAGVDGKANKSGHRGRGGFNGSGGKGGEGGGEAGGNGIGGAGGGAGGSGNAGWFNTGPFFGAISGGVPSLGVGGADGSGNGGHGGGGGGGLGGGGGGGDGGHSSCCDYGGAGGGGGGSFAYKGDAPPTENVPKIEAPGNAGALVIVIELG